MKDVDTLPEDPFEDSEDPFDDVKDPFVGSLESDAVIKDTYNFPES